MSVPGPLHIRSEPAPHAVVLALAGELDLATAAEVTAEVDALPAGPVVLDLAAVSFCDSSGLRGLIECHRSREDRGGLLLTRPSPPLARLLGMTGLEDYFRWASGTGAGDVAAALAAA